MDPVSSERKPWAERSQTIGALPGKRDNLLAALRVVLESLPAGPGTQVSLVRANGASVDADLDEVCKRQLSAMGLVSRRGDGVWVPAAAASSWLADESSRSLAVYLQGRVKFFGELLQALPETHARADLLEKAKSFGLFWTSPDQIHRRITWLTALGLVERWGNRYVLTTSGEAFLGEAILTPPDEAAKTPPFTRLDEAELPEPADWVARRIRELTPLALRGRKSLIGYIPRGRNARGRDEAGAGQSLIESVKAVCDILGGGATAEEFFERCNARLGMKKSSFSSTLHSFRHLGAIDLVAFQRYGVSAEFSGLLELGNEIDLVRYLHTRYAFVAEMLGHADAATPVGELVRIAKEQYGQPLSDAEVRTRLGFLSDAGLVERIDWMRYRTTELGRLLAAELPLLEPLGERADGAPDEEAVNADDPPATAETLAGQLRACAYRSDASEEFEAAVATAFRFLGFRAEHLGGSGRTDVLLTAELAAAERYQAIVEVKSSAAGMVAENSIKFDALKDHQRKHLADYGLVVGPGFGGRIRDWAVNNGFTLLTVDDLAALLSRHQISPLTLTELRVLFERTGDDLTDIEEQYNGAERSSDLITCLMELLYKEANDEEPLKGGAISRENISYALRSMNPRPTKAAIDECLQLLTHDLVRGAVQDGPHYRLADAPSNVMRRLAGLGMALGRLQRI
ncbi:hypothetical protein ACFOW4_06160 [Micromonospora sp. GCM10011542]|uniref:hypothetical protein n=1 Tax=Micromonospora sp. GCM10011542 TaxID=3317337 RepID=UPI003610846F